MTCRFDVQNYLVQVHSGHEEEVVVSVLSRVVTPEGEPSGGMNL